MKKRVIDKGFWLLGLIILFVLIASFLLFYKLKPNLIAENIKKGEQVHIQFLITDKYELVHSELFCYDPSTGQSAMFNIPVDTGLWISSKSRLGKISLLYTSKGSKKYIEAVQKLTGLDIPYTIELSRADLSDLIDLVGGVDLFLIDPVSLKFKGETRMLPPGSFTLYGYQALFYLQVPLPGETNSEFIKRKQGIIKLILQKAGDLSEDFSTGIAKKSLFKLLETNFDNASVISLMKEFKILDSDLMQLHRTRGRTQIVDGISLFLPQNEGRVLKEQVTQITKALKDESFIRKELLNLHLEILNGTKKNQLASRTTDHYQSYGYNVIVTGNADKNIEFTIIYARNNSFLKASTRIANIINCKRVQVLDKDPEKEGEQWNGSDVIVVLGGDYENLSCK